jgi:hypothetical protein
MKREHGWFQIGSGLVLSLLFLIVLPACKPLIEVKVDAQCGSEAIKDDGSPPKGMECPLNPDGDCIKKPKNCSCPK